jgi:SpoVK/Ycf46/Vps4 family AAA+-type ATPase
LQDDVAKRHPSVDLVLNLLCPTLAVKLVARNRFAATMPLLKQHLLQLFDDPSQPQSPLLGQYLKVDARVVDYLFDHDEIDSRLAPYVRYRATQTSIDDPLLPTDLKDRLWRLAHDHDSTDSALIFYLQGPYGVGKEATATALARDLGMGLLAVDGEKLVGAETLPFAIALRLVAREALLQNAVLFWRGFDTLLGDERRTWRDLLLRMVEERPGLTVLAGNSAWEPVNALRDRSFVRVELPSPTYAERVRLWPLSLNGDTPVEADVELNALATMFRFTPGQIVDAAATARSLARWRDPENGRVAMGDLHLACRLQSNRKLAELARRITPHYTWSAIVLPTDRMQQLREIVNQVKYRARVYEEWGFDRKLALGKGVNVLFAGPSGTGKTMAADIMAGELGLDLYKIDLSTIVSKYIGETEKNLALIFHEAENSNAILFFDEADALFGKRSEVRDSHDRYANIEISYLLQRMEEYDGMVILATNLHKNMDDAFVRRMHFTVEFPFPDARHRRRIWENIWPDATPCSPDLDLDFAARRFEIAGGNIRNVALAAAFLAAADGKSVDMGHLLHAMQREYQKMGKVIAEGEFRRYAEQVQKS